MTVMSDGCQRVEAAAEGGDAGAGHATPGGHDGELQRPRGRSFFPPYTCLNLGQFLRTDLKICMVIYPRNLNPKIIPFYYFMGLFETSFEVTVKFWSQFAC
jgi:hypothetical protein